MIKVIGGKHRGRALATPEGDSTRPTSSRARESLFNILAHAHWRADGMSPLIDARVLDGFAGSGALGIEALSRGDGDATFVESDPRAVEAIRENLDKTHLADRARITVARVERWRAPAGVTYTLVVADPPYHDAAAWDAIELAVREALAPDAVVVVEHEAHLTPPQALAGLALWRDRRQGAGAVAVYRNVGEDA